MFSITNKNDIISKYNLIKNNSNIADLKSFKSYLEDEIIKLDLFEDFDKNSYQIENFICISLKGNCNVSNSNNFDYIKLNLESNLKELKRINIKYIKLNKELNDKYNSLIYKKQKLIDKLDNKKNELNNLFSVKKQGTFDKFKKFFNF